MTENTDSLLIFPCEFAIKAFGAASDEFETTVLGIIIKHVPNLSENAIRSRPSKDGKYLALTITIHAKSQDQLDDIYRELSSNPLVLMAL
jgi:putative lipoic acid-binding regulatory protein